MRILILIDAWFPFVGGAQVHVKHLKKILEDKYGCCFFLLHSPSSNTLIRFLWSLWVVPQALWLHQKHHFDLIHAHAFWPGIPARILNLILKIPVVFTVHGSHLMDLKDKSWKAKWEKLILTKIKYDQVISVSGNFLKYKNVNQNMNVIANGVDIKKFKVQSEKLKINLIRNQDFYDVITVIKVLANAVWAKRTDNCRPLVWRIRIAVQIIICIKEVIIAPRIQRHRCAFQIWAMPV